MDGQALHILRQLLTAFGPSGYETAAATIWREAVAGYADVVSSDLHGNSYAVLEGGQPRLLLVAHIDEIGLMVSYIDDEGFLAFEPIGRWDAQVLVGQRIRLQGRAGDVTGVIGSNPIHLVKPGDAERASRVEDLWIDIGAQSRAEAQEQVAIGAVGVIDAPMYELGNGRVVSRAVDNRVGAFVVLETMRRLAQQRPPITVVAAATTQEEIGGAGARQVALELRPRIALVIDLTFAGDYPGADQRVLGLARLGSGPVVSCGSANNALVCNALKRLADRENIPYTIQINPCYTGTEADAIHGAVSGVATAVVSIPSRYMHSPNEMIALQDVEWTVQLLTAFARSLASEPTLLPFLA